MDRRAKNFVRGVESLEGRRLMAVAALSTMPLDHVATLAPLSFDYVLNGQFQSLGNGKDQILVDGSDYDDVIHVLAVDQTMHSVKLQLEQWSNGQKLSSKTVTYHDSQLDPYNPVSVLGKGGNDKIYNDTSAHMSASGGPGNDLIHAGYYSSGDTINGDDGDDTIIGGNGADYLQGSAGRDYIRGGAGNDYLYGGDDSDWLYGDAGNDFVDGGYGDDLMYGGAGNDAMYGWWGNDTIYGDDGAASTGGTDTIDGGDGNDILHGDGGSDTISGQVGNDTVYGDGGNDTLNGNGGNDYLYGGDGDDQLHGGSDTDHLYGENGNDRIWGDDDGDYLYGGAGNDYLNGGFGQSLQVGDYLYGGAGADTFVYDKSVFGFDDIDVFADYHSSEGDSIDTDWHW
jgi:Ca2+-binding RTX toxin-like protein